MQRPVYFISDYLITPLGMGTEVNMQAIYEGKSGLAVIEKKGVKYCIGSFENQKNIAIPVQLETLLFNAASKAIDAVGDTLDLSKTLLILASTKGQIDGLKRESDVGGLPEMAQNIASSLGIKAKPIVVCNACTSGLMAVIMAERVLKSGKYDHAVLLGGDLVSDFVISGFTSFNALSPEPCKPFDNNRNGLNLGEAVAAAVLSIRAEPNGTEAYQVHPGFSTNDANHISGPSRTGEGLFLAAGKAMEAARIRPDFIGAHGTATPYNDEMEATAFSRLGLQNTPVHSLKGYYGHTLGAAGLLEIIVDLHSLKQNRLIPSLGYFNADPNAALHIIQSPETRPLKSFLKTASGFGGTNAAVIVEKVGL